MFFPSPSKWNMVKDAPNHGLMNMIGSAHNSREILEDSDFPIFFVVLSTPDFLQLSSDHYYYPTGILLSTFRVAVNTICI